MSKIDPSKAKEAKIEFDLGMKAITTSAFKWKADFLTAEPHFKNAGRLYKQAGLHDSSLEALRKAVHCAVKMGNLKQTSVTLESTAREWSLLPGKGKETAVELYSEAAGHLTDADEPVRAADIMLLAGKLCEGFDKERAAKLFDAAAAVFDGQDDKDVYAVQPLQKVLREQLNVGKHASAMRTLEKLLKIYTRLAQPHNVYKALLSRVVLLLAAADPVAAQREFERSLDVTGYAASDEAGAAEDLIGCYTEVNADAMKSVAARNVINYLEPPVAKLAKGLANALVTGSTVGIAHAGESATEAVPKAAVASADGPAGFREFGQGSVIGSGRGDANATATRDDETSVATVRARKAADRDAVDRSALFSKPATTATSAKSTAGRNGGAGRRARDIESYDDGADGGADDDGADFEVADRNSRQGLRVAGARGGAATGYENDDDDGPVFGGAGIPSAGERDFIPRAPATKASAAAAVARPAASRSPEPAIEDDDLGIL